MKHTINLSQLSENELLSIDGGSEFSEEVVWCIGWLAGAWKAGYEDYQKMLLQKRLSE